jgi:hypothetical protein
MKKTDKVKKPIGLVRVDTEEESFKKFLNDFMEIKDEENESFDSFFSDNEDEADNFTDIDEVPFRPKTPPTATKKRIAALLEKIDNLPMVKNELDFRPLIGVHVYLAGGKSWVQTESGRRLTDKEYLISELEKKDISKFPIEIKELFSECLLLLKQ